MEIVFKFHIYIYLVTYSFFETEGQHNQRQDECNYICQFHKKSRRLIPSTNSLKKVE